MDPSYNQQESSSFDDNHQTQTYASSSESASPPANSLGQENALSEKQQNYFIKTSPGNITTLPTGVVKQSLVKKYSMENSSALNSSLILHDQSHKSKTSFKFYLKPKQRNLRHLRAIHVRNIQSSEVLNSFASGHLEKENTSNQIFRTGIIEQSINPSWSFELNISNLTDENETKFITEHESEITNLAVKIFSVQSNIQHESYIPHPNIDLDLREQIICEDRFNFNTLTFIGVSMRDLNIPDLPINCILLEFVDGIFISEHADLALRNHGSLSNEKVSRKSFRIDHTSQDVSLFDLQFSIEKLCGIQFAIEESQRNSRFIQDDVKKELERRKILTEYKQNIELRKSRIKRLRGVIEETKKSIEERKKELEERRVSLKEKHKILLESQQDLLDQRLSLSREQTGSLSTQKEELSILEQKYKHRQAMIVQQLSSIYMIGPHPQKQTNDLYINGLTICRGEQPNNDDEAASALGFVAHCVRILSKLFQIPLKYQIYALSSRSFVSEEGQNDQNVLLPLFMLRGSERPKYYKAIILLNLNLQHILKVKGFKRAMKSERKFDVLDNLQFLFKNLQK
ncbi:predicted protein [Naegleria gruberi]|uniref:Predicted protein n=1 Tax=Naegleria gruberi TaxID=5762 RepID=D2UY82_NAEGR|nr:uncharacterized protein NAEGRDRAFT_61379 [Naegleria gruberi]EFC50426.1 predicted protein [Naegleria gruberi]|eukprot:XP_002683170.1 predicted protein [Naegleria gruberi strain NEG-M]